MQLANGVAMLEISHEIMGRQSVIYPTLIWDDTNVILVDAGFPGQLELLRDGVEKAGVPFTKLNKIILTHHDVDHMGSLASILGELPEVEVLAHTEEKPYIEGTKRPLKLAQMEARLDSLPEQMKSLYQALNTFFAKGHVPVNNTLTDGQELPYAGGIIVIFTPGHTLGHICLYLKQSKTLVCGDSLGVEDGKLIKPAASINFDQELTAGSLKKLTQYDIDAVISYHGGLFKDNVNQRLAELAAE